MVDRFVMNAKNRPRRPGLREVAARAGVDVSTVSRVLSGDRAQRTSDATRIKIVEAARALDYRPNTLARALRTARTQTIGIVVPQLDNPVFSSAILGAEASAAAHGYSLLITHRDPKHPTEGEFERLAATHRVDGLLVSSLDDDRDLIASLEATGIPFVLMNRRLGSAASVALDSEESARLGTKHLLDLGHRSSDPPVLAGQPSATSHAPSARRWKRGGSLRRRSRPVIAAHDPSSRGPA